MDISRRRAGDERKRTERWKTEDIMKLSRRRVILALVLLCLITVSLVMITIYWHIIIRATIWPDMPWWVSVIPDVILFLAYTFFWLAVGDRVTFWALIGMTLVMLAVVGQWIWILESLQPRFPAAFGVAGLLGLVLFFSSNRLGRRKSGDGEDDGGAAGS